MALHRHGSELLQERRDISGSAVVSRSLRLRRGRKFGRLTKRMIIFLALLFLVYLLGFGVKLPFHGSHHRSGLKVPMRMKNKQRKQYFPCEVGFAESIDNLVEPKDFMNFTQFSIRYIDREEISSKHGIFEARFGGHQTLQERENSFSSRNQALHCGFVKGPVGYPSTGFDLNEKDTEYMNTCHIVVSSCIFGSSDFLRRPTSKKLSSMLGTITSDDAVMYFFSRSGSHFHLWRIASQMMLQVATTNCTEWLINRASLCILDYTISDYSKKNVCFVMFMDELTKDKLSSEGKVLVGEGYAGLWRIVVVKNLPYTDMRKTGKVPKFLPHRLFPSARYSIWLDSKLRLQADPMLILEYFLWRKGSEYAISNHYDRHCVWEEVLQNKRLNKYNHAAIDEQFQFYQSDGLIKFNATDDSTPLPSYVPEGSFIVRAHSPMSNLFSCLWFNEVDRFTSRDQLSFAYTFLKLRRMNPEKPFFVNMFKDCERRALVKLFHHRLDGAPPTTVA